MTLWTSEIIATHRIMQITCATGEHSDPADVLTEANDKRWSLRHAYHYRTNLDARWHGVQMHMVWLPRWTGSQWSATATGTVYLGHVSEGRFLDLIGDRHGLTLQRYSMCLLPKDIYDHTLRSMTPYGMARADDEALSMMATAIDRKGGFKALMMRRGLQVGGRA